MGKCYFFDIDGTILPHGSKEIPNSTKEAIKKLIDQGNQVFIASGKNQIEAEKIGSQIGISDYISSNGQQVFIDGINVITHKLPTAELNFLVGYYHARDLDVIFQCERAMFIYRSNVSDDKLIEKELSKYNLPFPKDVTEVPIEPVLQIIVIGDMGKFEIPIKDYKNFILGPSSCEVLPFDASKGTIISKMKDFIGTKQTYAFGDGPNDIDMFKQVNVSVAMGEASDKVKSSAEFLTAYSYEDGINSFLETHNLI